MYPVDLMKVRKCVTYVTRRHTDELLQTRMQIINPASGGLYTGISNAVSTIYRMEGLRTLWRGVSSVVVGAGESDQRAGCSRC